MSSNMLHDDATPRTVVVRGIVITINDVDRTFLNEVYILRAISVGVVFECFEQVCINALIFFARSYLV